MPRDAQHVNIGVRSAICLLFAHRTDKKEAYSQFLMQIEEAMRVSLERMKVEICSVIVWGWVVRYIILSLTHQHDSPACAFANMLALAGRF